MKNETTVNIFIQIPHLLTSDTVDMGMDNNGSHLRYVHWSGYDVYDKSKSGVADAA